MKERILEWLVRDGLSVREVQDEGASFHLIAEVPPNSSQFIDVLHPEKMDFILVASGIKLSEEHERALMNLAENEREKFMWEIRFGLIFLPTEFKILPDSKNPRLFQFTRKLYIENLTRQSLMDAVAEVHKCKLFIIWKLREKFGERRSDEVMYV
ncbi:MAG: hypothetical protein PWR13_151 [Archaeoglobi archaeon]|nr:hypothetical protein [Archaeoglobi archaeon]